MSTFSIEGFAAVGVIDEVSSVGVIDGFAALGVIDWFTALLIIAEFIAVYVFQTEMLKALKIPRGVESLGLVLRTRS